MSTLDYKQTQKLSQELTVYGFIRCHCNVIIPQDVAQLCAVFYISYHDRWTEKPDTFDKNGRERQLIDKEENTVENIDGERFYANSAYGALYVERGEIHTWKIELLKNTDTYQDKIKMSMTVCTYCPDDMSKRVIMPGLRFYKGTISGSPYAKYCDKIKLDDIVEMRLDMRSNDDHGTLSYIINGEDKGIACDSIDLELRYRLRIMYKYLTVKLLQ